MKIQPKSRFSRLTMVTLAGTIALGGLGAMFAHAESGREDAAHVQAISTAKLTLADAVRTAGKAGQGIVTGAEFEVKNGSTWYEVTTQKGSNEVDHRIDPMTGEILASTSGAQEKDGDSGTEEAQEFSAIQGAKFSLLKAISEAEAQGNKVLGAEFEHEDDKLAIELRGADAAGVVSERMIAADTGSAIPGDQDDRENDDGESAEDHEG